MKVILTGATGYIGGAALEQCIKHPDITSIVALSRHELPEKSRNPKLKVLVVKDYERYPPAIVEQIQDADACIWCIGDYNGRHKIIIDYPLALSNVMRQAAKNRGSKFRFILLGGALSEQDQNKSLWVYGEGRKANGLAEIKILEFESQNKDIWEAYVAKPGVVLPTGTGGLKRTMYSMMGAMPIVQDELGAALVHVALHGAEEKLLMNDWLVHRGKAELSKL